MAVTTYKCDTCQREIDLVRQPSGIDHIGHCNITLGCRGNLYQVDLHLDYIRGELPSDVQGLQNWQQRKVLYNYTQTVPRSNWIINHDLGTIPEVEVYINEPNGGVEVLTQVIASPTTFSIAYTNANTVELSFKKAFSGIAQCIARSSNPDLLNPRTTQLITAPAKLLLTNLGEITIATKNTTVGTPNSINIILSYTASDGSATSVGYTATNSPNTLSPWNDVNTVMIQGKTYTVRTFNMQTIDTINGTIQNGAAVSLQTINSTGLINLSTIIVPGMPGVGYFQISGNYTDYFLQGTLFTVSGTGSNDGTQYVSAVIYDQIHNTTNVYVAGTLITSASGSIALLGAREINSGEVLILLGNPPFTTFDKITNQYIDFTAVNTSITQFSIYINTNELYTEPGIIQTIYPPIRQLS